jgi:hypothetical protein
MTDTEYGSSSRIYSSSVDPSDSRDTSMNTNGSSSGGVRLATEYEGLSSWQTTTTTRARRTVASTTGATASDASVSGTSNGRFNVNAYGNPRATPSISSSATYSPSAVGHVPHNPAPSTRKFANVRSYVKRDSDDEKAHACDPSNNEEFRHPTNSDWATDSDSAPNDDEIDSSDDDDDKDDD